MLSTQGIISNTDWQAIEQGLNQIRDEIRNNQFTWQLALEDVHLNIEKRLTHLIEMLAKDSIRPAHAMIRSQPIFAYSYALRLMKS